MHSRRQMITVESSSNDVTLGKTSDMLNLGLENSESIGGECDLGAIGETRGDPGCLLASGARGLFRQRW